MTVIAAIVLEDRTIMMADSSLDDPEHGSRNLCYKKMVRVNEFLCLGFAGDWAQIQRIKHELPKADLIPPAYSGMDDWVYRHLVCPIREILGDSSGDWEMLMACRDKLYVVDSDYCYYELDTLYGAIGAGSDLALGRLYSSNIHRFPEVLEAAMCAAEKFNAFVCGPMLKMEISHG